MIRLGGRAGLINAYFVAILGLLGVIAAAYGVAAVLRLRSEETEQRAEAVLATPVGRLRWAAGHLVIAAAGTAALLAVAGLSAGLAYGQRSGDVGSEVSRLLEAALVQVPAAWLVAALVLALVGLVPRLAVSVGWGALGVVTFLTLFGPVLQFSHWVLDVSPFTHVPKLPGGTFTVSPLLWLAGVALALTGLGLAGLRRRDLS
jgi:ABC-2 type transport system permease protein